MIKAIFVAVALWVWLLAPAAFAGWGGCDAHHPAADITNPKIESLLGVKELCYDFDDTTDSSLLDMSGCQESDLKLFNMTDGDTSTFSVIPMACPSNVDQDAVTAGNQSTSTTHCEPIVADLALATNQEAQGYGGSYVFFQVVTNTGTDAGRGMVRCNAR